MAASAVATERLGAELFVKSYDCDPGSTGATYASPDGGTTPWYLDMRDYLRAGVMVRPTIVGGNGITLVEVYASTDVAGATSATLIKTSGAIQADSLNDVVFLEWTAEEIAQAAPSTALRYVTVKMTNATNTDESNLTFIGVPRRPQTGLTATLIT